MVADHNDHEQGSSSGPDQQGAGGLIRTEDAEDAADDAEEAEDEEKLLPWQAYVHASPITASTVECARWCKRVGGPKRVITPPGTQQNSFEAAGDDTNTL